MTDPDQPAPEPLDDAPDQDIVAADDDGGGVLGLSPAEAAVADLAAGRLRREGRRVHRVP